MKAKFVFISLLLLLSCSSCSAKNPETFVCFETTCGKITVKLYPETSLHRQNFLKLVDSCFYDGLLFHRVISGFMIQGGDPASKHAKPGQFLGDGDVGYTVPAEFMSSLYYHKRGVLAAARESDDINPLKASSGCQFYIVHGKTFTDEELNALEEKRLEALEQRITTEVTQAHEAEMEKYREANDAANVKALRKLIRTEISKRVESDTTAVYSARQRADYKTLGGAPHLDGNYTVFGEVVQGMEVVDSIAKVKTDPKDRPLTDVRIIKAYVVNP